MPNYRLYGKWYHLQYSDYFAQIVKAQSPRAALYSFAKEVSGVETIAEVQWDGGKPGNVSTGRQEPNPAIWAGGDQLYKVRTITLVKRQQILCPSCNGSGTTWAYMEEDHPHA